ncbi:MAG: hypothetical protein DCC75_00555 [Proteobacteria bacterium]|nr:MAG: hypothetical protein DCC75_00555 [Pseudomonadota bacterium]
MAKNRGIDASGLREAAGAVDLTFLAVLILVAALLRLDFLIANNFIIDADEAIVGLMGKHISEGRPIPVFYYGQHYMGSLEALAASLLFEWFGISQAALKVTPLFFSLLLVPLIYALTLELGGRTAARSSALLMAVPPCALVVWSGMARGGFIEVVFLGAVALLLTCKWLKREKPSQALAFLIGLVLGLGWWTNNQIVYFMLPIGFAIFGRILWSRKEGGSKLFTLILTMLFGLTGFWLGGAPFWIYNFQNDFVSFSIFGAADQSNLAKHWEGLWSAALPIILGARRFWQKTDAFAAATTSVYVLWAFIFALLLLWRFKQHLGLLVFKIDPQRPLEIFTLFIVSSICIFTFSSFGWLSEAPRYLLPLYIGLFPLAGCVLETLYRGAALRYVSHLCLAALLAVNLLSSYMGGRALPGEPFVHAGERVSKDHGDLLSFLAEKRIGWVRTNYWIGYRLAFETCEQVKFLVFGQPHKVRIAGYQELPKNLSYETVPFVLVPSEAALVRRALDLEGFRYQHAQHSGYSIFFDIESPQTNLVPIARAKYLVSSSHHSEAAALAIDGDINTRWGSASPQAPGMEYVVQLEEPAAIRGFLYNLGDFQHDSPRSLQVQVAGPDGELATVLSEEDYKALRYLGDGEVFEFIMPPRTASKVIFRQLGRDSVFDWSIAELQLLE